VGTKKKMHTKAQLLEHNRWHERSDSLQTQSSRLPDNTGQHTVTRKSKSGNTLTKPSFLSAWDIRHSTECAILTHGKYYNALNCGNALEYLVAQQFHDNKIQLDNVDPLDAELHTLIAFVGMQQSKQDNQQFAKLLKLIDQKHKRTVQALIDDKMNPR
jgi:hypothetical protein